MNLIEKLGLEKCKQIVDEAPDKTASHYVADTDTYFSEEFRTYFSHSLEDWETSDFHCAGDLEQNYGSVFSLADLKAQIDHHYYGRSEAEELAAYAELSQEKIEGGAMLVGDFSKVRERIQSVFEDDGADYVTDIKNHISPTTVVIER